jgi:hypothetical protein
MLLRDLGDLPKEFTDWREREVFTKRGFTTVVEGRPKFTSRGISRDLCFCETSLFFLGDFSRFFSGTTRERERGEGPARERVGEERGEGMGEGTGEVRGEVRGEGERDLRGVEGPEGRRGERSWRNLIT